MSDSRLLAAIRNVPDFPRPGILFRDVTPLIGDGPLFRAAIAALVAPFAADSITHVAAVESRGFLFGAAIADRLGAGLLPVRKAGKLPAECLREEYALEYGTDALELHRDACGSGARVLVVDDVLATGGTARAACALVERAGAAVVGIAVLIEIEPLGGRAAVGRRVESVIRY